MPCGSPRRSAAIAERPAVEWEAASIPLGAIVAMVRTEEEWTRNPQSQVAWELPLVSITPLGEPGPSPSSGPLPLSGVRVLDLTRVIAGPVATRDLALAGADVLRVDDPGLAEPAPQLLDTGQGGKRSTLLDLRRRRDRCILDDLLNGADVVVTGYRPGSLDAFGLSPEQLAGRGVVVGTLSAWGTSGPWGHRRGFDSIVQATVGIADAEGAHGKPGALPVQALDYAAGHFLAAGIAEAPRRAGAWHVSTALARLGQALLAWLPHPRRRRPSDGHCGFADLRSPGARLHLRPHELRRTRARMG